MAGASDQWWVHLTKPYLRRNIPRENNPHQIPISEQISLTGLTKNSTTVPGKPENLK